MYQFKKIADDEYKLITDKNEYTINRTVDIAKELQSVDLIATTIVAEFLSERGETYDNTKLVVTREKDGKTYIDESNLKRLEIQARNQAYYDVLNRVFTKTIGIKYMDIIRELDISFEDEQKVQDFVSEFTSVIINGIDDTPRVENTQRDTEQSKE